MAETFYGVLGVSDDADSETIRRAYREQVKEHHPDVSDDPDAPERFKRLTTARNVLVNADERSRYDRLGHSEYVEHHVDSTVWSASEPRSTDTDSESATGATGETASASDGGYDRTVWLGEDGPDKQQQRQRERSRQRRQQAHAAGATATAAEWQHASKAYRRAETNVNTGRSPVRSVVTALRSVGPWIVVHLVFVASAAATAWLAFSQLASYASVSWPTLVLGILLVGVTVFVSVLHVISQVYS
jgi:curved DNA-binding protein CbpA